MSKAMTCWNCSAALDEVLLPVSRHEYCSACSEAVHCCRQCVHYAPGRAESCAEDRSDPPTNKETANFCDYFAAGALRTPVERAEVEAQRRLAALFGEGTEAVEASDAGAGETADSASDDDDARAKARAKLDALFGNPQAD